MRCACRRSCRCFTHGPWCPAPLLTRRAAPPPKTTATGRVKKAPPNPLLQYQRVCACVRVRGSVGVCDEVCAPAPARRGGRSRLQGTHTWPPGWRTACLHILGTPLIRYLRHGHTALSRPALPCCSALAPLRHGCTAAVRRGGQDAGPGPGQQRRIQAGGESWAWGRGTHPLSVPSGALQRL